MLTRYIKKPYHKIGYIIQSNNSELLEFLDKYLSPFTLQAIDKNISNINIQVLINGELAIFKVNNNEYTKAKEACIKEIVNIIYATSSVEENILPLHTAAISKDNNVYLFAANTKAGKSTLTTYLCHKYNYEYISDDVVMLDKNTLSLLPYYKPIMLRPDSVNILSNKGVKFNDIEYLKWGVIDRCHIKIKENEVKNNNTNGIYFIERNDTNSIIKLDNSETFNILLKSLLYSEKLSIELLNSIKTLSLVDCYKLTYNDLDYVNEVLNGKF